MGGTGSAEAKQPPPAEGGGKRSPTPESPNSPASQRAAGSFHADRSLNGSRTITRDPLANTSRPRQQPAPITVVASSDPSGRDASASATFGEHLPSPSASPSASPSWGHESPRWAASVVSVDEHDPTGIVTHTASARELCLPSAQSFARGARPAVNSSDSDEDHGGAAALKRDERLRRVLGAPPRGRGQPASTHSASTAKRRLLLLAATM
jgi:hypothetical protein